MIDRFESQSNSKESTLLEQISKSIQNVFDNDQMRSKIRAQLLKFENDRKANMLDMLRLKKKVSD